MKHTPLLRRHRKAGATLGEWEGWLVPLRYDGGAVKEGLADWSWITKIDVRGLPKSQAPDKVLRLTLGGSHELVLCEPSLRGAAEAWTTSERLSVTDVTGGWACMLLVGSHGRHTLAKVSSASPPDPGRAVQSRIAHAPGIMLRSDFRDTETYWILTPRDYAEDVWESLLHAGEEFHIAPVGLEQVRAL